MRPNLQALMVAAVAMTLSAAALAGDVYKYIDANGQVNYVDRPSGDPSEQRLNIVSKPTNRATVQARVQARLDTKNAAWKAAGNAPEQSTPEEARSEREKRQQNCKMYRDRLVQYVQSRRLYREDEQGKRVYLNDEELQAARDSVEQQVQEHCDT